MARKPALALAATLALAFSAPAVARVIVSDPISKPPPVDKPCVWVIANSIGRVPVCLPPAWVVLPGR